MNSDMDLVKGLNNAKENDAEKGQKELKRIKEIKINLSPELMKSYLPGKSLQFGVTL